MDPKLSQALAGKADAKLHAREAAEAILAAAVPKDCHSCVHAARKFFQEPCNNYLNHQAPIH